MCEVLDRVEEKGVKKGIERGKSSAFSLVQHLIANNRMEDLEKALEDMEYCDKLMEEFSQKKA